MAAAKVKAPSIKDPRILLLDIETSPLVVYAWSLWDKFIPAGNIVEPGHTLCFTAKWLGEDEVLFHSTERSKQITMLRKIHKLLEEADAVIHYNGKKFDIPVLEAEFLLHGLPPPSPFTHIDLLQTTRRFRLPSRKLDYICQALDIGSKTAHKGMDLWRGCMNGDRECWAIMEQYNRQDVVLLEELYYVLRPWLKSHINLAIGSEAPVCPVCGSHNLRWKGYRRTATGVYKRFVCNDCGRWGQSTTSERGLSAKVK